VRPCGAEDEFEITGDVEQDPATRKFDAIIGALEEFIMNPEFQDAQELYCRSNCGQFEVGPGRYIAQNVLQRFTNACFWSLNQCKVDMPPL